jgi:hypothetical protein
MYIEQKIVLVHNSTTVGGQFGERAILSGGRRLYPKAAVEYRSAHGGQRTASSVAVDIAFAIAAVPPRHLLQRYVQVAVGE